GRLPDRQGLQTLTHHRCDDPSQHARRPPGRPGMTLADPAGRTKARPRQVRSVSTPSVRERSIDVGLRCRAGEYHGATPQMTGSVVAAVLMAGLRMYVDA